MPKVRDANSTNYRAIAEAYFQKTLLPDEVVHHIDGDHNNNNPDNLVIMKKTQHLKLHGSLYSGLDEWSKRKKHRPCNSCMFVRFYELNRDSENKRGVPRRDFRETLWTVADTLINWGQWRRDDLRLIDFLYEDAKQWKQENAHDCYVGLNVAIVKDREPVGATHAV